MTTRPIKQPVSGPELPEAPTRLGAISFINTLPIYFCYAPSDEVTLVYASPAELNRAIDSGELDISPVSSAHYLRNREALVLLDDLSVSSPGSVESVVLVSQKPLDSEFITQPVIGVPDDSETSIALLSWLLMQKTGVDFRPRFKTYAAKDHEQALAETCCILVIGDRALTLTAEKAGNPNNVLTSYYFYDLASLWQEETGLPCIFAVWVARKDWAQRYPDVLSDINQRLVESRERFLSTPAVFETGLAFAENKCKIPKEVLSRYFTRCLNYRLSENHRKALEKFQHVTKTLDLISDDTTAQYESSAALAGTGSEVSL